jgi:hypothetical protein
MKGQFIAFLSLRIHPSRSRLGSSYYSSNSHPRDMHPEGTVSRVLRAPVQRLTLLFLQTSLSLAMWSHLWWIGPKCGGDAMSKMENKLGISLVHDKTSHPGTDPITWVRTVTIVFLLPGDQHLWPLNQKVSPYHMPSVRYSFNPCIVNHPWTLLPFGMLPAASSKTASS